MYATQVAYLDFDQLFDSINDEHVFVPIGPPSEDCLIAGPHPAIDKCLPRRLSIVVISQDHRWRLHNQLSGLIVPRDFVPLRRDELSTNAWQQRSA